jgi:hypothetical protein
VQADSTRPSADVLWERRSAARFLRRLDTYESFAASCEGPLDAVRIASADRYREILGVPPAARHVLRERLMNLNPGSAVADIVEAVCIEFQENGSAVPAESSS